jgi:hypothetical protein
LVTPRRGPAALKELRRKQDEDRRQREAIWAEHQAIINNPRPPLARPRIRRL